MVDRDRVLETGCWCASGGADGCAITVRVGDAEAFAPDAEAAVVAAFCLIHDASAAGVPGYVTARFFDGDGRLVGTADGSKVFSLHRRIVAGKAV